jgi:hypothetical protein
MTKNGLGYFLGDVSLEPSGHPAALPSSLSPTKKTFAKWEPILRNYLREVFLQVSRQMTW